MLKPLKTKQKWVIIKYEILCLGGHYGKSNNKSNISNNNHNTSIF